MGDGYQHDVRVFWAVDCVRFCDPGNGNSAHAQDDFACGLHEICIPICCATSHWDCVDCRGLDDVFVGIGFIGLWLHC